MASNVRRYSMILPGATFSGYVAVQVPENASKIYTDEAVRQMFASAVIRKEVPVDEQLGLLPFKVSELGDFKNVRTLAPGGAVILADGDETAGFEAAPFMVIGFMGSTLELPEDRGRFAEQAATSIPGVRRLRITMSEPVRIDGLPGYETRSMRPAARTIPSSPWCSGCGSVARPRCALSAAPRAINGRARFPAFAPCATELSSAEPGVPAEQRDLGIKSLAPHRCHHMGCRKFHHRRPACFTTVRRPDLLIRSG